MSGFSRPSTAAVYPGTCFFEGTNVSEGRGTERPFEYIGAPFIEGKKLAEHLNQQNLPGVIFEAIEFTPQDIPSVVTNPKHKGVRCRGVFVNVKERNVFEPVKTAVYMLAAIKSLYPNDFQWRGSIDRLAATPTLRLAIDTGVPPEKIVEMWKEEVEQSQGVNEQLVALLKLWKRQLFITTLHVAFSCISSHDSLCCFELLLH